MKQLFFIGAIVALASCGGTEDENCVTPMADSCVTDTVFLPDSVALNNYLISDSIANVSDLLDTLAAYEPAAKMTH